MIRAPHRPCSVPDVLNLNGMFALRSTSQCGCEPATPEIDADKITEFCNLNRTTLDTTALEYPEGLDDTQQAYLEAQWRWLVGAYIGLYERTCNRFHNCSLHIQLSFPNGDQADDCGSVVKYNLGQLGNVIHRATSIDMVTYTDAEPEVVAVNLPERQPVVDARWRIDNDPNAGTTLSGQLRFKDDEYPAWPAQDLALPAGVEGTTVMRVRFGGIDDHQVVAAIYELALLDADSCSPSAPCKVPDDASSLQDDGYGMQVSSGGSTPNTSVALRWRSLGFTEIKTVDNVIIRYQCEEAVSEFATTARIPTTFVAAMFWAAG